MYMCLCMCICMCVCVWEGGFIELSRSGETGPTWILKHYAYNDNNNNNNNNRQQQKSSIMKNVDDSLGILEDSIEDIPRIGSASNGEFFD